MAEENGGASVHAADRSQVGAARDPPRGRVALVRYESSRLARSGRREHFRWMGCAPRGGPLGSRKRHRGVRGAGETPCSIRSRHPSTVDFTPLPVGACLTMRQRSERIAPLRRCNSRSLDQRCFSWSSRPTLCFVRVAPLRADARARRLTPAALAFRGVWLRARATWRPDDDKAGFHA